VGMNRTQTYRQARDQLQELGRDYARAVAEFSWPDFGETFNWAVDWFDAIARGNDATALWIVEEDGRANQYSFDADGAPFRPGGGVAGRVRESPRRPGDPRCSATRSSCGSRCWR
jgi:hypothetical protein